MPGKFLRSMSFRIEQYICVPIGKDLNFRFVSEYMARRLKWRVPGTGLFGSVCNLPSGCISTPPSVTSLAVPNMQPAPNRLGLGMRPPAFPIGQGPSMGALAQQQMSNQFVSPQAQKLTTLFVGSISGGITDHFLNQLLVVRELQFC